MYGILADYSGIKDMAIDVPEKTSISGFINSLRPEILNREWMDPEQNQSIMKVFRNGELVTPQLGSMLIEDGDDIRFFSAISGG
jgi:hypothetical protein